MILVAPLGAAAQSNEDLLDFGLSDPNDRDYYSEEGLIEVSDEAIDTSQTQSLSTTPTQVDDEPATPALPGSSPSNSEAFESYKESLIDSWGGKKEFTQMRLSDAKENLVDQQQRFEELENQIEDTEEKLKPITEEISTLEAQLERINSQIRFTQEKITNVEILIAEKKIQIKESLRQLEAAEIEVKIQEGVVLDFIKLLYGEQAKYLDIENNTASSLKLLLQDRSVSESLLGEEYVAVMEETGRRVFQELDEKRQVLEEQQLKLLREQEDLDYLYQKLNKEKRTYEETKASKEELLEKTEGEEEKYQLLLEESRRQQLESAIAVQSLQDSIEMIETALGALDNNLSGVYKAENLDELSFSQEALEILGDDSDPSGKPFIWPVPKNTITATFHDPSYPYGVHNAIDIRASQYTEIRAPADALISKVAKNGYGYSYIVLAHKDNLITVYGHISESLVEPGMTVRQGEVIGLSGGTPGTLGAGNMTTGPHLHWEVWKDGVAVDPQKYLRDTEDVEINEEEHNHVHEE